jgi:hypothetical protein
MKPATYMAGTVTFDGPGGSDIARKVERLLKTGRDQDRSRALRLIKEHASELVTGLVAGQDAVLLAAICAWVEQMPAGVAKEISIEKVLQSVIAPSLGKMLHGRRIADRNNYPPIRKGRFLP